MTIKVHQKACVEKIVWRYSLSNAKTITVPSDVSVPLVKDNGSSAVAKKLYQSMAGALLYVSLGARPDITHLVGVVGRFLAASKHYLMTAVKRIFCHLKETSDLGLVYPVSDKKSSLIGYSHSDWAGHRDNRYSTSGYTFLIGDKLIGWRGEQKKP